MEMLIVIVVFAVLFVVNCTIVVAVGNLGIKVLKRIFGKGE